VLRVNSILEIALLGHSFQETSAQFIAGKPGLVTDTGNNRGWFLVYKSCFRSGITLRRADGIQLNTIVVAAFNGEAVVVFYP